MSRKNFINCFESAKGRLLREAESAYLKRSITVGCKQAILQIGGLGWEDQYIDCSLYQRFAVLDRIHICLPEATKITASNSQLPITSDSIDMVILPHTLEFAREKHQLLREVERVLKPEGKLTILAFNPWNVWVQYHVCRLLGQYDHIAKGLMNRHKIMDWLKLLNFEVEVAGGFNFSTAQIESRLYKKNRNSLTVASYAIKAVKRRYTIIPLATAKVRQPRFSFIPPTLESSIRASKYGR